jgi:hypothetical protein
MCPFTTSALPSLFLVRASLANKQSSIPGGWGLGAKCLCVEPELFHCVHFQKKLFVTFFFGGSKWRSFI